MAGHHKSEELLVQTKLKYLRSLPDRLGRAVSLWEKLEAEWNSKHFDTFLHRLRWIAGNAACFQCRQVLDAAHPWYLYLREFNGNTPPPDEGFDYCRSNADYFKNLSLFLAQASHQQMIDLVKEELPDLGDPETRLVYLLNESPAELETLEGLLSKEGYRVETFTSFLDMYMAFQKIMPDLLVTSAFLHGSSAAKTLETFRKLPDSQIPAICTIREGEIFPDIEQAADAGIIGFISMPLNEELFLKRVKEAAHLSKEHTHHVLVVDEDELTAKLLETFIQAVGHTTSHALDTKYILRPLDKQTPDLVLFNLDQVAEDPLSLIKTIRAEKHLKEVPMLFLSFEAMRDRSRLQQKAGPSLFLEPGLEPGSLLSSIASMIQLSHARHKVRHAPPPLVIYDDDESAQERLRNGEMAFKLDQAGFLLVKLSPDRLEPGTTITGASGEAYRLAEPLDELRSTSMYLAHRLSDNKEVVARFFFPGPSQKLNGTEKRLHREVETLMNLSSSNVVNILDAVLNPDNILIVSERIGRTSLADELEKCQRFPAVEATRTAQELLSILACLDENNLIHRDIRPSNLYRAEDGQLILANFDLIPYADLLHAPAEAWPVTPTWNLAPEQLTNGRIDHRTDIFGLGATYFNLLTGKEPFPKTRDPAALKTRIGQAPDPRTALPGLSPQIAKIIMKMMAPKARHRHQNENELAWDLEYALGLATDQAE